MTIPSVLALDFDGVLCDSRQECAIVSANAWLALHDRYHTPKFQRNIMPEKLFERFIQYRYLVRTAAQYALLWDIITQNVHIHHEKPLELQTPANPTRLRNFRVLFFALRQKWRNNDFSTWLTYNPIYPAVFPYLEKLHVIPNWYIVSAKDKSSIVAILEHNGLHLDDGIILDGDQGDKNELLHRLLQQYPNRQILFVDDNIENLSLANMPGVQCFAADWGYGGPNFTEEAHHFGYTVISPHDLDVLTKQAIQ